VRIVFVDNLLIERSGLQALDLQPHLGLISLCGVAESAGHSPILYDPKIALASDRLRLDSSLYQECAAQILAFAPDVVGMTSLGCNFICTAKIARYLKRTCPDLPILLGGPHASVLHQEIMGQFPEFDIVVRNEAELTLLSVLEGLHNRNWFGVPGVTFRTAGTIWSNAGEPRIENLDELPLPAYHCYPISELELRHLRVEAGRGCPFACTFCSTAGFFGRKYRLKSSRRLLVELNFLHARYGLSQFSLNHDLFTASRPKVVDFCHAVMGLDYRWRCSARMDCVDDELLELMRAAGCTTIYFGVETGSPRMQKISGKHLDLTLVKPVLRKAESLGIATVASFITGYPEEIEADQDATLDLAGECVQMPNVTTQLHLLTPEPGTPLIAQYRDQLEYDGHISDFNFPTLEPDDSRIMHQSPTVFMNHHYYRSATPRSRHVLVTSLFAVSQDLGVWFLRHLLGYYQGRFSLLCDDVYHWFLKRSGPFDSSVFESFIAGAFGQAHYLFSLVRYLSAARSLAAPLAGATARPKSANPTYVWNPAADLISDLHPCKELVEFLMAQPQSTEADVPTAWRTARRDYVIVKTVEGSIHHFTINAATVTLLDHVRRHAAWADSVRLFSQETGLPPPSIGFLHKLIDNRILVDSNALAPHAYRVSIPAGCAEQALYPPDSL
jgi:radical SAM superfamily enzyme YgiQ (UPF0313 family)